MALADDLLYEAYLLGLKLKLTLVNGIPISLPDYYASLYPGFTANWTVLGPDFILWNNTLITPPLSCNDSGALCIPLAPQNLTSPPLDSNYTINFVTAILQPYSYQYLYGIENIACASGTDCTDCGASTRVTPLPEPGVIDCSQNNTLSIFSNVTLHLLQVNLTTTNISLACPFHCPFFQCADGSCVDFENQCAVVYQCPGNGCLQDVRTASGIAFASSMQTASGAN